MWISTATDVPNPFYSKVAGYERRVLGFVWCGAHGRAMSSRLLDAGHSLCVLIRNAEAMKPWWLAERGSPPRPRTWPLDRGGLHEPAGRLALSRRPRLVNEGRHGTKVHTLIDLSTTGPTVAALSPALATAGFPGSIHLSVAEWAGERRKALWRVMVSCAAPTFAKWNRCSRRSAKTFYVGDKPGLGRLRSSRTTCAPRGGWSYRRKRWRWL